MFDALAPLDLDGIGEDVPLLEGLRTARAIRRLRPDPVPFARVRQVCEAGTRAPSGTLHRAYGEEIDDCLFRERVPAEGPGRARHTEA